MFLYYLDRAIYMYELCILINILFSWIRPSRYHPVYGPVVRFIYDITEPFLSRFRFVLNLQGVGFDFAPFIAIFVINLARQILYGALGAF